MKTVILLGTKHSIQRDDIDENKFESLIKELIKEFDIKAIGEEIDTSCNSVANKIADIEKIKYIITEPTPKEKKELEIEEPDKIDYFIKEKYELMKYPSQLIKNNESFNPAIRKEYVEEVHKIYRLREKEWKRRVEELDIYPILLICGSCHFKEFSQLLKESGFEVVEKDKKYGVTEVEFERDCFE